jgi:hypothetical protein
MLDMSRVSMFWAVVFGFVTHAQAQDDGPAPVNSQSSLSARPDDTSFGGETRSARTAEPTGGEHPRGTYTGVAPGSGTPAVPIAPGKNPATITWPGFQMRPDGSSRVFIQSTTPLEPQPSAAGGKLLISLPGAKVSGGTNRLPLDTRFFNTPVTRVRVNVNREGTQLVLDLRPEVNAPAGAPPSVTPRLSSERGANGYYFTYIDLPGGLYVAGTDQPKAANGAPSLAAAARPQLAPPERTTHLESDGHASAEAQLQAADDERPPAVKGRLKAGIKLGK